MRYLCLLTLVGLLVLPSCKKYENGPLLSLQSKEKRLVNSWQYDVVLRNGLNVTKGEGGTTIDFAKSSIGFDKTGRFSTFWVSDSGDIEHDGFWTFADKKEGIQLDILEDSETDLEYTILRLRSDELWLSESVGDIVYQYQLSPNK